MTVTPVNSLVLSYAEPKSAPWNPTPADRSTALGTGLKRAEAQDALDLSKQGLEASRKEAGSPRPVPAFGRLNLGPTEPLPFGPDQNANALNRIPGDGTQTPPKGVEFGHQPVRGLNIVA